MVEENRKKIDKILKHYGRLQIIVAIEELSELQKELCKDLRGKINPLHLAEELGDAYLMLEQLKMYYGITDKGIENMMEEKLNRTIKRMEEDDK